MMIVADRIGAVNVTAPVSHHPAPVGPLEAYMATRAKAGGPLEAYMAARAKARGQSQPTPPPSSDCAMSALRKANGLCQPTTMSDERTRAIIALRKADDECANALNRAITALRKAGHSTALIRQLQLLRSQLIGASIGLHIAA